jgi:hypothetical protein
LHRDLAKRYRNDNEGYDSYCQSYYQRDFLPGSDLPVIAGAALHCTTILPHYSLCHAKLLIRLLCMQAIYHLRFMRVTVRHAGTLLSP